MDTATLPSVEKNTVPDTRVVTKPVDESGFELGDLNPAEVNDDLMSKLLHGYQGQVNEDAIDIKENKDKNKSPDKQLENNSIDSFSWIKAIHKLDKAATYSTIAANIISGFAQIMDIPDKLKKGINKTVDFLTNLSFIPYGLDGMRIGMYENKNPYMSLGYFLELASVWFSNTKNKYLVRGAATGLDQSWVATDKKLEKKYPGRFKDGKFSTWAEGFYHVPTASFEMILDMFKDPVATLFNFKGNGYNALVSTLGDLVATIGYAFTGQEKIFGTIRDISAALFDWEMLLSDQVLQKISGFFFIVESTFDFLARFMPTDNQKLFVNHLSIGAGRIALMCYKNSNPNANK